MPEGLKFRMCSDLMRDHCLVRAEWHLERSAAKSVELVKLKANLESVKSDMALIGESRQPSRATGGFEPDQLIRQHQHLVEEHERARVGHLTAESRFRFMAEHVFDEDYTLSLSDMTTLEIVV